MNIKMESDLLSLVVERMTPHIWLKRLRDVFTAGTDLRAEACVGICPVTTNLKFNLFERKLSFLTKLESSSGLSNSINGASENLESSLSSIISI